MRGFSMALDVKHPSETSTVELLFHLILGPARRLRRGQAEKVQHDAPRVALCATTLARSCRFDDNDSHPGRSEFAQPLHVHAAFPLTLAGATAAIALPLVRASHAVAGRREVEECGGDLSQ